MKKLRKLLILVASLCMVLGMALTANADTTASSLKLQKLSVSKNITTYVNGDVQTYFTITYQWEANGPVYAEYGTDNPWIPSFRVVSANGAIARYDRIENEVTKQVTKKVKKKVVPVEGTYTTTARVYLKDANVGKVKFTVSLYGSSVKAVSTTLTLKSYANIIVVGAADADDVVTVAKGSKISLDAYAAYGTAKASNAGVSYAVADKKIAPVSGGKVTGKALGETTIAITSGDKKATKTITVKVVPAEVTNVKVVNEKNQQLQKMNITLSTGDKADNKTADLLLAGDFDSLSQLKFTSSNASVATVDENGKITAIKNGSATIKVAPVLGNNTKKNVVEIKVTVYTAVETLSFVDVPYELLNNKKAQKITAEVNATASNKSVKYEISKITSADGTSVGKRDWSKYAKVDSKKGTIAGYKVCTVEVKASAGSLSVFTNVDVIEQCPNIYFSYVSGKKTKTTNALTKTVVFAGEIGENDVVTDEPQTFNLYTDLGLNEALKTTSSFEIYLVEGANDEINPTTGDITIDPEYNGITKVVIEATDGSGKKATVTFKKDIRVSELNVWGNSTDEEGVTECVIKANTKTDVTKLISAQVNWSASNQGVTYSSPTKLGRSKVKPNQVKLTVDQEAVITVTTNGTDKNGNKLTKDIKVKAVASDEIATSLELTVEAGVPSRWSEVGNLTEEVYEGDANGKTFYMYADSEMYIQSINLTATEGRIVDPNVTYTFKDNGGRENSSSKIIKVNEDRIIALKAGTVDVTMTSKQDANAKVSFKIIVGKTQDEVATKYYNLFASTLAEENLSDSYGTKATFNKKTGDLNLEILQPAMSVSEWRGNNGRSVFARPEFANISNVYILSDEWDYETDSRVIYSEKSRTELKDLDFFGEYGNCILADYIADYGEAMFKVVEYYDGHPYVYAIPVYFNSYASDATIENYFDTQYEKLVEMAKEDPLYNEDEAIVTYNKATNTLNVEIVDKDYDLAAHINNVKIVYYDLYERIYLIGEDVNLQKTLDLVEDVNATFTSAGGICTEFGRTNLQSRDKENINYIFTEERINKLRGKTLADLDGAQFNVCAGGATLSQISKAGMWESYNVTVNFKVSASAFDNAKDVEIADAVTASDILTYDGTKNELTMAFSAADIATLENLQGHGLGTVFDTIKGDAQTVQVVSIDGAVTKLTGAEITKDKIGTAVFVEQGKTTVSAETKTSTLVGKTATIKTTYANGYTFVYTIVFDVTVPEVSGNDADIDSESVEVIDEIIETEEETEEEAVEESEDVSAND